MTWQGANRDAAVDLFSLYYDLILVWLQNTAGCSH